MPTNNHATDQATNDELAALYLRDRDTPCPKCNYNRRDGTTSTCPECGTEFQLTEAVASTNANYKTLTKATLLLATLIALVQATHHFSSLVISYFAWGSFWATGLRLWTFITMVWVVLWLGVVLFSGRLWIKSRSSHQMPTHHVIAPIVIIFVFSIVQVIFWVFFYYL